MNHGEIVSFVWGVADLIRDTFRRGHYQDVILPLTVLRRLDCVLADTKERVLARQAELQGRGLQDLQAQLRRAAGFAFYNTSRYDFEKLLADALHLAANLRNYIAGFSQNMRARRLAHCHHHERLAALHRRCRSGLCARALWAERRFGRGGDMACLTRVV